MPHVVLLGDSIFDNAAYVPPGAAVIDQLRVQLPAGWQATLAARDGSRIADVHAQLAALPDARSHLVLSVGGNDLLAELAVLGKVVGTVGEGLRLLLEIQAGFFDDYDRLLRAVASLGLPTLISTVYEPSFPDETLQREANAALCLFNDVILRAGHRFGMPVLELRAVCTDRADYSTPIEPSVSGGAKIAAAIESAIRRSESTRGMAVVFP